jgi:cell shape-determining protein MreC
MSHNLNDIIKSLESETVKLNNKINSLQDERRNLQGQLSEERSKNAQLTKIQNENRELKDLLKEKELKKKIKKMNS